MITFSANKNKFEIPINWDEVILEQSINLSKYINQNKDEEEWVLVLSAFTGLPISDCKRFDLNDVNKFLLPALNFLNEPFDKEELFSRPIPTEIKIGDLVIKKFYSAGQLSWSQHLNFESVINDKSLSDIEKLPKIISICIQKPDQFDEEVAEKMIPEILKMELLKAFAISNYFITDIKNFYEKINFKNDIEYTTEQIRAGIKEFSKFGVFNSIDSLAGGDITKWNQVVMLPMADVVLKLKINNQQSRYEKKYHEIISKKK